MVLDLPHVFRAPEEVHEALPAVVQRIVDVASPRAVILFGSHAEGRAGDSSDFDLLVIADTEQPRLLWAGLWRALHELYRERAGNLPEIDLLVLTPERWEHEAQLPGLLYFRVKRRGVVVYGTAP